MFAQSYFDFGLSEGIFFFVRVIATVGGAIVGWFAADPLTRVAYRLSFKGATPTAVLLCSKLTGAATLALLIWFLITLGGGGGGLGWGQGLGGGPGKGPGPGGSKGAGTDSNTKGNNATNDSNGAKTPKAEPQRERVKIEILGGPRFKNDGHERYYLVLGKNEPARSLKELDEYLKKRPPSLIEIIHTEDTFVVNTDEDPTRRLQSLRIPIIGPKTEP
jgi:hypothetical protein